MVEKMSVHRALSELKNYEDRLSRAMRQSFVYANKKSNTQIDGMSIKDAESFIQGNYDRVRALISNKKKIKAAVVLSNAVTHIEIAGRDYTVAEAIERKSMIELEERFLATLTAQYNSCNAIVVSENNKLPSALEGYLSAVLGNDRDKRSASDVDIHTKAYYARNEYELVDPCNIKKYIDQLYDDIQSFKTEVDYRLSESNATTFIDVELDGKID